MIFVRGNFLPHQKNNNNLKIFESTFCLHVDCGRGQNIVGGHFAMSDFVRNCHNFCTPIGHVLKFHADVVGGALNLKETLLGFLK